MNTHRINSFLSLAAVACLALPTLPAHAQTTPPVTPDKAQDTAQDEANFAALV